MRFEVHKIGEVLPNAAVVYRSEEHSFDTDPSPAYGFTSLTIDDLNLEIDATGNVISIWGYCPSGTWRSGDLDPPLGADYGKVVAIPVEVLVGGVSIGIGKDWPIRVDRSKGWVRIGRECSGVNAARVLTNAIIELGADGEICALWLNPSNCSTDLSLIRVN
jgi:hypothetical protein